MVDINNILDERGSKYGSFENHARICQTLKAVISTNLIALNKHLASDQQQALDVICDKIARMVNGDSNYIDNWVDIAGYATLVMNRLKKDNEPIIKDNLEEEVNPPEIAAQLQRLEMVDD